MAFVNTWTTTFSVLTRLFAFIFLRIIPGWIGTLAYYFFAAYTVGVFIVNRRLALIESEPERTLAEHQQKQVQQAGEEGSDDEHETIDSSKVVVTGEKQDGQSPTGKKLSKKERKRLSYAEVAAKNTPAEHEDESEQNGDLSSSDATLRPPNAHLARPLSVPSRPNPLHLIFGSPSNSRTFNLFSLGINGLLVLFCADFQFTPLLGLEVPDTTFVRVGAVSENSVKLVARIPPSVFGGHGGLHEEKRGHAGVVDSVADSLDRQSEEAGHGPVQVVYRPTRPQGLAWLYGGAFAPEAAQDYVSTLKLNSLLPSTEYEYALLTPSSEHSFIEPSPDSPQRFKTWPDPRLSLHQTHYTFAATSCIKPNWPYVPGADHTRIPGAVDLAKRIVQDGIEFMMFMGDFIYADVPSKIATPAAYAKKYRQVFASKDYRRIYEKIPTLHIYDDHEIINDYAGASNDSSPYFQLANPAYSAYLGNGNPDPALPNAHYYSFQYGDSAFFVWDSRRYRSAEEDADDEDKTMLGAPQKAEFVRWLGEVNNTVTWKFIVSSVPFMTLWGGPNGQYDTWGGYQTERSELMDLMEYVPNIIVLSGDRHEFAAALIRGRVLDFSISPLNQFTLPIRTLSQNTGLGATGEDRLLKYIPDGSRKFATFEVDTRTANRPTVQMKLYVDGKEAWKLDVIGRPVHQQTARQPSTGIGRGLATSLSELLGFGRGWF